MDNSREGKRGHDAERNSIKGGNYLSYGFKEEHPLRGIFTSVRQEFAGFGDSEFPPNSDEFELNSIKIAGENKSQALVSERAAHPTWIDKT